MDTIYALATAQGRAGVAVVRLSGDQAFQIAKACIGKLPKPRVAGLRKVRTVGGEILDEALVLCFEGPKSFTGEDVVELHLHGSPAIAKAVLRLLSDLGARLADPGEFTRRALENNRLDLVQVEALGDLIAAETEAQRQQAMRGYDGALTAKIESWRSDLIRAAALIEATIDFADEEVPEDVTPEVMTLLLRVKDGITKEADGYSSAERIRSGFEVAIVGAPNAGKSTLLNAMARREAAITSHVAGTTRDVIEVRMDLEGIPVTLLDTAGLRQATDEIEAEGVSRAKERGEAADLRVFLKEDEEEFDLTQSPGDIVLRPKADIRNDPTGAISGKSGYGVQSLMAEIASRLSDRVASAGLATQERHRIALEKSIESLNAALDMLDRGEAHYDLAAEEIRATAHEMSALIGRVDVENLLDEIFSSFCLGK